MAIGAGGVNADEVLQNVSEIARGFATQRRERQQRTSLDRADFDALANAGVLLTGVPASMGGLWVDVPTSTRPFCEILRVLATGDSASGSRDRRRLLLTHRPGRSNRRSCIRARWMVTGGALSRRSQAAAATSRAAGRQRRRAMMGLFVSAVRSTSAAVPASPPT